MRGWLAKGKRVCAAAMAAGAGVLLMPATLLGRAGGGEAYGGGFGGSGGFGGGGFGGGGFGGGGGDGVDLIVLFKLLFVEHPAIGISLTLVVLALFWWEAHSTNKLRRRRVIRRGAAVLNRAAQDRAIAQLRQRDPDFDINAFYSRCCDAFRRIQAAWCAQDLSTVRPFISDGIAERFSLQFDEQRDMGERNQMDRTAIHRMSVAAVQSGPVFDVLSVRIVASAVDYYVSLQSGRRLRGSTKPQEFVEVWSWLRRRGVKTRTGNGLIEGNCPNCGALVELNQWSNCKHCGALLRSGEYDWVLAEITQECEWRMPTGPVPGVAELREVDPEFNLQAMEDRASVVFWRWAAAQRLGNVAPLWKVADEQWCQQEQTRLDRIARDGNGSRRYVGQCAVGSVEIVGILHEEGVHRALVEVRWSGRHFRSMSGYAPQPEGTEVLARTMFVFEREAWVRTDADKSLSSAHCPSCGAPESGEASDACAFCGTTANRTRLGWVLVGMHDWQSPAARKYRARLAALKGDLAELEATREVEKAVVSEVGRRWRPENHEAPAELLAWAAQTLRADPSADGLEAALLRDVAARYGVPDETLDRIVTSARLGLVEVSLPEDREEARHWLEEMAAIAVADGRINRVEERMLRKLGRHLGYSDYDVRLVIRRQYQERYGQAKAALRAARHDDGWDGQ